MNQASNQASNDRRREPRIQAGGMVVLRLEDPVPSSIHGDLLDISNCGFRVAYLHPGLSSGQEIGFEHAAGSGRARAMWTRVMSDRVETGFLVL